MQPVLHRIFVKPDKAEEVDEVVKRAREAGLAIELDKREKKAVVVGTVVAIGSTCYLGFNTTAEEQGVKVGSRVMYAKYSGADVPNKDDLIILNDEDLLAILGEDE